MNDRLKTRMEQKWKKFKSLIYFPFYMKIDVMTIKYNNNESDDDERR